MRITIALCVYMQINKKSTHTLMVYVCMYECAHVNTRHNCDMCSEIIKERAEFRLVAAQNEAY